MTETKLTRSPRPFRKLTFEFVVLIDEDDLVEFGPHGPEQAEPDLVDRLTDDGPALGSFSLVGTKPLTRRQAFRLAEKMGADPATFFPRLAAEED